MAPSRGLSSNELLEAQAVHREVARQKGVRLKQMRGHERAHSSGKALRYAEELEAQRAQLQQQQVQASEQQRQADLRQLQDQYSGSVELIGQGQLAALEYMTVSRVGRGPGAGFWAA